MLNTYGAPLVKRIRMQCEDKKLRKTPHERQMASKSGNRKTTFKRLGQLRKRRKFDDEENVSEEMLKYLQEIEKKAEDMLKKVEGMRKDFEEMKRKAEETIKEDKKEIEKRKKEVEKSKKEIEKSKEEIEKSKEEVEKGQKEVEKAREEKLTLDVVKRQVMSAPIDKLHRIMPYRQTIWSFTGKTLETYSQRHLEMVIQWLMEGIISCIPVTIYNDDQGFDDSTSSRIPLGVSFYSSESLRVIRELGRDLVPFLPIEVIQADFFGKLNRAYPGNIQEKMFDLLISYQRTHGVARPYGLITTYDQTRVCWIDEDAGLKENRILKVSEVLEIKTLDQQRKMIEEVASAVVDGYSSPITTLSREWGEGYFYNIFSERGMLWERANIVELVNSFPTGATKFCFLREFPKGAEGRTYHVCCPEGRQGVLKFPIDDNAEAEENLASDFPLTVEQARWLEINDIKTSLVTVCGFSVLLMPYLEPATVEQRIDFLVEESSIRLGVIALLKSCVDRGFYQTDASWRHIGWYKCETGESQLKLLDFGHLEVVSTPQQKKDALDEMVKELLSESKYYAESAKPEQQR